MGAIQSAAHGYWGWGETLSILSAEAELALAHGELSRAARRVEQLLGKYGELKLRHLKPGILYLQARIALALSDEMAAHREVWAMCSALGELKTELGNEAAAAQLRERACTEVAFIADHSGTPELRAIFRAQPEVRNIAASCGDVTYAFLLMTFSAVLSPQFHDLKDTSIARTKARRKLTATRSAQSQPAQRPAHSPPTRRSPTPQTPRKSDRPSPVL